eukprot:1898679-Rhodomonas_salina.3
MSSTDTEDGPTGAMSGTDAAYGARSDRDVQHGLPQLPRYLVHSATGLRACYAIPGTDTG